jgi:hypothetical protein
MSSQTKLSCTDWIHTFLADSIPMLSACQQHSIAAQYRVCTFVISSGDASSRFSSFRSRCTTFLQFACKATRKGKNTVSKAWWDIPAVCMQGSIKFVSKMYTQRGMVGHSCNLHAGQRERCGQGSSSQLTSARHYEQCWPQAPSAATAAFVSWVDASG